MSEKARNLEILAANRIAVPKGFTLPAEHYQTAMKPLVGRIIAALPTPSRIERIFQVATIHPKTMRFLIDHLALLPEAERFAVRSSGAVVGRGISIREDSASVALAGQFDSFLNVPRELVPQAVLRCWASLFNERSVVSFGADREYVLGSAMSVVIQEMIPARTCAVMMTCDPTGDGETGAIEFSWGPCEAIVSGFVSPDEAIFHRGTRNIVSTSIGSKAWQVRYADFAATGDNAIKIATAKEDRTRLSMTTNVIADLVVLGQRIEQVFERPQDVELVITPDGRVVVTQSRAVTTLPATRIPFNT